MLTLSAVKVVADGVLGSRGLLTVDRDAPREVTPQAPARGFQGATHAIGDGAHRFVLDA